MKFYDYKKTNDVQNNKYPLNTHLVFEVSSSLIYFVDTSNAKLLLKTTDKGATVTTIETRTGKDIARAWHDMDNNIIYFVDCDYDDSTSYIWKINSFTGVVTEITSVPADVFDIWLYDDKLYYSYFSSGYELTSTYLEPNGDGLPLDWSTTGGNNYGEIDEGATPVTADYVSSTTKTDEDEYTFPNGLDLSVYDYYNDVSVDNIYEIVVRLYGKAGTINVNGNLAGMTEQKLVFYKGYEWLEATFSGLVLEDSDLDALEITIENDSDISLTNEFTTSNHQNLEGLCYDGTNIVAALDESGTVDKLRKFNSGTLAFVSQHDAYSETMWDSAGMTWDVTNSCYWLMKPAGSGSRFRFKDDWSAPGYSQSGFPATGVFFDGTDIYYYSHGYNRMYKYTSSGLSWSYDSYFSWTYGDIINDGLYHDGTDYWALGLDSVLRKFNSSWVLQESYDITDAYNGDISDLRGLLYINSKIYTATSSSILEWTINYAEVATMRVQVKFYGDELTKLVFKNHTLDTEETQDMGVIGGRTWESSQIVNVDDQFWFLWKWSDENAELWKYDVSGASFTEMEDCGSGTDLPDSGQQWGMSYDDNDTLFFVLKETATHYLYTYGITGDELTKGGEYNAALMLNRNTNSSNDLPFNLEKGFDLTSRYVYQIPTHFKYLHQISDLTTEAVDGTIVAITDTYLFIKRASTDVELWEYEDSGSDIDICNIKYKKGKITTAKFSSRYDHGVNMSAFLYDDNDVLLFGGSIIEKIYDGVYRTYKCVSFDKEMNDLKISYTPSAIALNTAMEYVLDQCNYLYHDSSITANGTTITADWKNTTIKDMLDTIADLADWIWYVNADGKVYFNDGTEDTGHTITNTTGEVSSAPIVKDVQAQINYVMIYGGFLDGIRLVGVSEDTGSQQIHGIIKYIDHYPHITNQTQLNTLAAAILARTGIADNPKYVYVNLYGLGYEICGERINFAFSPLSITADDFNILSNNYDAVTDVGRYELSSGLIEIDRVYGKPSGVKTQSADEEQLDILGAEVGDIHEGIGTDIYKGTYNFEDDTVGGNPTGWTVDEGTTSSVEVIASLDGHAKVMDVNDTDGGDTAISYQEFTSQTEGTVEFWIRVDDATLANYFALKQTTGNNGPYLLIDSEYLYYDAGGGNVSTKFGIEDDTWYHIRIDFEVGAGGYMGLAADTFYIYVNGVRLGPYGFNTARTGIDILNFNTGTGDSGYSIFVDAVGYSWDSDYDIGDNKLHDVLVKGDSIKIDGVDLRSVLGIGPENSLKISLPFQSARYPAAVNIYDGRVENLDGTDNMYYFKIPLPLILANGLKLYISGIHIGLNDGDGNDYVNSRRLLVHNNYSSFSELINDGTNLTGAGDYELTFTPQDVSGKKSASITITTVVTTIYQLDLDWVSIIYYYDD